MSFDEARSRCPSVSGNRTRARQCLLINPVRSLLAALQEFRLG